MLQVKFELSFPFCCPPSNRPKHCKAGGEQQTLLSWAHNKETDRGSCQAKPWIPYIAVSSSRVIRNSIFRKQLFQAKNKPCNE